VILTALTSLDKLESLVFKHFTYISQTMTTFTSLICDLFHAVAVVYLFSLLHGIATAIENVSEALNHQTYSLEQIELVVREHACRQFHDNANEKEKDDSISSQSLKHANESCEAKFQVD
jgi:hypothetical protein